MTKLEFLTAGKRISGGSRFSFKKSMDYLAHQFAVEFTGENAQSLPITPNEKVEIYLDGQKLSTGHFEIREPRLDKGKFIVWSGRSKTADLVDCSVQVGNEKKNLSFKDIANAICSQFSIPVSQKIESSMKFKKVAPFVGETAFNFLERLSRKLDLLLLTGKDGELLIDKVSESEPVDSISESEILKAQGKLDFTKRFSQVTVFSQVDGLQGSVLKATQKDSEVSRFRPKEIISETMSDYQGIEQRAKREIAFSKARNNRVRITLPGAKTKKGKLWDINRQVNINSELLGLNGAVNIVEVEFVQLKDSLYSILTLQPGGFE